MFFELAAGAEADDASPGPGGAEAARKFGSRGKAVGSRGKAGSRGLLAGVVLVEFVCSIESCAARMSTRIEDASRMVETSRVVPYDFSGNADAWEEGDWCLRRVGLARGFGFPIEGVSMGIGRWSTSEALRL
ncbi:uncharacterized protein SCHCODRAFT_02609208 [Schizophyllum commune H4-8]|uniref:uncharacterized protein n=1 Tax=Schizophyllum commune (strain H4-8 / FGSC 9210) TaxID=578458 RepID=UPI0021608DCF|nr:uncharacterized protein SCHCODRAFT_02609208 [Schizophyllum commune H4-8]KAI5897376.1 hypothetical protein SCHCODRAFT_02609208 [Schizophyllum commune H4-8]